MYFLYLYYLFIFIETNAVFSKLGAGDIVARYDKLLHEWKLLKDAEHDFKKIMGLDCDRPLVKCLDSIPPGMYISISAQETLHFSCMCLKCVFVIKMHLKTFERLIRING